MCLAKSMSPLMPSPADMMANFSNSKWLDLTTLMMISLTAPPLAKFSPAMPRHYHPQPG